MAARAGPPFRADHVGSLLRPVEILRARERFEADLIPADELRAVEDESIRQAVEMQEEVGLQAVTDGELRRRSWQGDFLFQLGGVSTVADEPSFPRKFRTAAGETLVPPQGTVRVDGRITLTDTIFGEDFKALRSMTSSAIPKLTIPSPSMLYLRCGRGGIAEGVYPDLNEFWTDVVAAYREEIRRLHELGCTYLQIDDVSLAMLNDPALRAQLTDRGDDADHLHLVFIRRLNEILAQKPDGMAITAHMCRGNFRSAWAASGSYEFVAESLFGELQVDGFFVEYDDDRSGGFEPLRFLTGDRLAVLGLVTTKRGELESKDALKRRIDEASRYVPLDRLCLSPQCGFASNAAGGNDITYEQQVEKLRLVVETAQEVWG